MRRNKSYYLRYVLFGGSIFLSILTFFETPVSAISINDLTDAKTVGYWSVFLGAGSGSAGASAERNTGVGWGSLRYSRGSSNTAIGMDALHHNFTGSKNTALGLRAGYLTYGGSGNVFIGYSAGKSNFFKNKHNQLIIANSGTSYPLIYGNFQTKVLSVNGRVYATRFVTRSDGRLKKDIKPLTNALPSILKLEGKTYLWRTNHLSKISSDKSRDIGLIAQDVEKVFPQLVSNDQYGFKSIEYQKLTAVLVEAVKEQQKQIDRLKNENKQLKLIAEHMESLMQRVDKLETIRLASTRQ